MDDKSKTKTILLTGFGPNDYASHKGGYYHNGSAITMDAEHADTYIKLNLAREVPDKHHKDVKALQELEQKNHERREEIRGKVNGHV